LRSEEPIFIKLVEEPGITRSKNVVCGEDKVGRRVLAALVNECAIPAKTRKRDIPTYFFLGPLIVSCHRAAEGCVFLPQFQQTRVRWLKVIFSPRRERNERRFEEGFVNPRLTQERDSLSPQIPCTSPKDESGEVRV